MERDLQVGGICSLKSLLHSLPTKLYKHMKRTLCLNFLDQLTLLLSYILCKTSSTQWLCFNEAKTTYLKNFFHLRR